MNNSAPDLEFKNIQYEFAAYIRNPATHPAPKNIEQRRLDVYTELFYNNIEGFLNSSFPIIHTIYTDTDWHAMARDFFATHHCKTPYFLEIAQEFLHYLQQERQPQTCDPAFLLELAHYEWTELAVSIQEDEVDLSAIDPNGDLLAEVPVLAATAWPLAYQFDVHHISPEYLPEVPNEQATHLVVYRDHQNEVHFLDINPVTARLIQLIRDQKNQTGQQILATIAAELNHPKPEVVVTAGKDILLDLRHRDILLGTSRL